MLNNYEKYLSFIQEKISKFFDKQKDYIACKKGCAKCCKNAQYPYSEIELKYLLCGFLNLDNDTKEKIEKNFEKIKQQKANFKGEKFLYTCPFLIDESCSVYNHRGLVCRTFGLITAPQNENEKTKIPFCCFEGLNYANVYDKETKMLSEELVIKNGFKNNPTGFNISYKFLTNEDFEKAFNFKFGEKKALIDWFIDDNKGER